jgi:hypothetical protein
MEPLVGSLLTIGGKLIDKLIPDPEQKAKAQLDLLKMQQEGQLQELQALVQEDQAQNAVNQVEAQSESFFKSGWRPAVGWICVIALFYQTIIEPITAFILANTGHTVVLPDIDNGIIGQLLFGLLGVMGGYRTLEKIKIGGAR